MSVTQHPSPYGQGAFGHFFFRERRGLGQAPDLRSCTHRSHTGVTLAVGEHPAPPQTPAGLALYRHEEGFPSKLPLDAHKT